MITDDAPLVPHDSSSSPSAYGGTDSVGTSESTFSVFISYRVDPDQPLAIALKEMIESAIEPSPRVFVSGAGGLRPSNIGFKPQIQAAAQSARAFVAIITQESKDREWIFFEAGCAWGRSQLYSPLLIDTTPGELGSSIADYQAVRANERVEVSHLLDSIAQAVGGKVKPRFGIRYRAFESRLQAYSTTAEEEGPSDDRSPLGEAIDMLQKGEVEAAKKRFEELESQATSAEEKAHIRSAKILNTADTTRDILMQLRALNNELGALATTHYWLGVFEPRQTVAIRHLKTCLQKLTDPHVANYIRRDARIRMAAEEFRIGNDDRAYKEFREALADPSPESRSHAARSWLKLDHKPHALEKLLLLSSALFDEPESSTLLHELVELCLEHEWKTLLIYLARRAGTASGTSANNLGRAYSTVELWSLAYLAYANAAEQGLSVAKVNMASLSMSVKVPAVGLKILQEHSGPFDAADAGLPYDVRARLERAVQNEEKEASTLAANGNRLFTLLSNFAWEATHGSRPRTGQMFEFEGRLGIFSDDSTHPVLSVEDSSIEFESAGKTLSFLSGTTGSSTTFVTVRNDGTLVQLVAELAHAAAAPRMSEHQAHSPGDNEAGGNQEGARPAQE